MKLPLRVKSQGSADAAKAGLREVVAEVLADHGYVPSDEVGGYESSPSDEDAIKYLEKSYDERFFSDQPVFVSSNCSQITKMSFEDETKKIEVRQDTADLLLLIRARGTILTKGGKVESVLGMGYGPVDELNFTIGIVERTTGNLVYFCRESAGGDYADRPASQLTKPVNKCLKRLFERKHGKIYFQH